MNVCCFLVVENWTPIVLILDHIIQVPLIKPSPEKQIVYRAPETPPGEP